jgi:gas vesicle protein
MEDSNNTIKMVGALLVGAAVGGALGILLAPGKGSDTRKKIIGKTDDLNDALHEKFKTLLDEVKKEVLAVKEKASHLVLDGQKK